MATAPVACSGEMYEAVPSTEPAAVSWPTRSERAMPKSVSTSVPLGRTSRLPGFTSRCTMPFSCAACSASAACASRAMVRAGVSRPTRLSVEESASPSTYSITRKAICWSLPKS
ncbi:hypothetical protein B0E53_05279 [Micromonospora sp. MH33]|nr:hypothetical protein B0E53_05279 [Micromonospora sp. MH33]